jgi:uncharacterized protein YukE
MADRVNANPADIKKLAAALGAYKGEVSAAGKKVQGALAAANWHDPQKDKFEARYRNLQSSMNRFLDGEVDVMIKNLNTLAAKLAEIQSVRF